ncbi:uncharacterized protein [Anoplolepis gracilipes]|uniref:uncharacterized protein n=1 Tax=Anoplolepis gracilipes TaxID=354296 RepID=UPI003BA3C5AC
MIRRADIENLHTRKRVATLIPAVHQFDIQKRVFKVRWGTHFSHISRNYLSDTMEFFEARFVLFAFTLLSGVYCSNDLEDVSVSKVDVDYQNYQDLDKFLSMECEEHEEYSECSGDLTCQKTCENMDQWETMTCARTKVCIRGCICEDGYVRDDYSGVCVRENSCPRVKH